MSLLDVQVSKSTPVRNKRPEEAALLLPNSRTPNNLTTFVKSPSCYRNLNELENTEISITPVRRRSSIASVYEPQQYKGKQLIQSKFEIKKFSPLPSFFYMECDNSNKKRSKPKLKSSSSWKRLPSFNLNISPAQPQANASSCQESRPKPSSKLSFMSGFIKRNKDHARNCDNK